MRRPFCWLIATAGAALAFAVVPAAALAASQPTVEWTSAWSLTTTDATLGAGIDVESLEHGAYYQFQVVTNTSEYLSEIACPPRAKLKGIDGCGPGPEVEGALPIGFIPSNAMGSAKSQSVSLDLASVGMTLKPGTTYHYRVLAARRVQTEDTLQWEPPVVVGPDQTFTTPAAEAPTVEAESASHVTSTDATLEATINPQAAERGALYQFQFVTEPSKYPTEFTCPAAHRVFCALELEGEEGLPLGTTHAGVGGQGVNLDLAHAGVTLKPGTTYHYRVIAARFQQEEEGPGWEGPIVYGPDETLTTPPANGPVIESVSVSHLTPNNATLEATIDTDGLSTSYEFQLWSSPCSHHADGCELLIDIPLPTGLLLGSFVPQTVSLDLNSVGVKLHGGEYGFSLAAASKEGSTTKSGGVFEPPEEQVAEPLGSTVSPTPTGLAPVTSSGGSQSSSSSSPTTPGTSSALGTSSKTGAGTTGGKPKAKHGKHGKHHKHHGTKAAKRPAKSKKQKR